MTSQTLITDSSVRAANSKRSAANSEVGGKMQQSRSLEAMKTQYQLDQQVKFLHLQAETETLLRQLQAIKQQRQAMAEVG